VRGITFYVRRAQFYGCRSKRSIIQFIQFLLLLRVMEVLSPPSNRIYSLKILLSEEVFSSVTSLNLTLSPPADKSLNSLHKVLSSMVNLRDLMLIIFERRNDECTHFVKSSSIAQNIRTEVPPIRNLTSLIVQGTLGAYSAYLTARIIKSTTKFKCLSLP